MKSVNSYLLLLVFGLTSCAAKVCKNLEAYDFSYYSINGQATSSSSVAVHDFERPIRYVDLADGRILLSGVLYSPETTLADYQAFKHVTVLEPEGGVYRPLYNYDNHQISHLEFKRLGEDEIVLEIYFKDQSSVWVAHGILTGRRLRCIENFPTTCDLIKQFRAQAE